MWIGRIANLAVVAVGIAAGLGEISFWWVLLPAFFAGSLSLSNGPHYQGVMLANQRGSVTHFPLMLSIYWAGAVILGSVAYGLTRLVS